MFENPLSNRGPSTLLNSDLMQRKPILVTFSVSTLALFSCLAGRSDDAALSVFSSVHSVAPW